MLVAVSALLVAQTDTVLVLRSPDAAWRPLEDRLAAELEASGFAVHALDVAVDPAGDVPAQLWARCRSHDAVAAFWFFQREDGRVDAWVADNLTAKAVLRTYERPTTSAERARLALQAVELLHASLLEVRLMGPALQREHPQVRRFAEKPRDESHLVFGTGIGMAVTPGLRPQPLLELQLGWAFRHDVTLEGQALTSVFPARVDGPMAAADVGVAQLRTQVLWQPLKGRTLSAGLALATGVALTWASGSNDSMGVDLVDEAQAAWMIAWGLVVSARLNEGIRLQLLANAAVTVPEIAVRLQNVTLAKLGRPIFDALLRLEFE